MNNNLKAMIIVLVIAAMIFRLAKPVALLFSTESDFVRRRNTWFALTMAAFLTPGFWLFVLVAIPLLVWSGRKDSNPVALYLLMMQVVPPTTVNIPVVGINELFSLDIYRLLSFTILIPLARRLRTSTKQEKGRLLTTMDTLLLAFGALHIVIFIRPDAPNAAFLHDSVTNVLRRSFLFFVDIWILYYVVSRFCSNRRLIAESLASFCLVCGILAAMAVFESSRHWLLYFDLALRWGGLSGQYLDRGGVLRAAVSTGHALALGYLLAIGFGFWLYLRTHVQFALLRRGMTVLLLLGLLFAYSRGPWLGSLAIYLAFVSISPKAASGLIKASSALAILVSFTLASPMGDRFTRVIPFLGGTVDAYNVTYRQQLAERSMELIQENPIFGDPEAYSKLGDIRQGQGIIDFVNVYADVAVFYGLIGLLLFASFILVALLKVYALTRRIRESDPDLALLGVSLAACIFGVLIMLSGTSFIFGTEKMFYVLGGLAAAFAKLGVHRVGLTSLTAEARLRSPDRSLTASFSAGRATLCNTLAKVFSRALISKNAVRI